MFIFAETLPDIPLIPPTDVRRVSAANTGSNKTHDFSHTRGEPQ